MREVDWGSACPGTSLLAGDQAQAGTAPDPLRPKRPPHFPADRQVGDFACFMEGGPSHLIDLFDPKPELERLAGQAHAGVVRTPHHRHGHRLEHHHALQADLEAAWPKRHLGLGLVSRKSPPTSTR